MFMIHCWGGKVRIKNYIWAYGFNHVNKLTWCMWEETCHDAKSDYELEAWSNDGWLLCVPVVWQTSLGSRIWHLLRGWALGSHSPNPNPGSVAYWLISVSTGENHFSLLTLPFIIPKMDLPYKMDVLQIKWGSGRWSAQHRAWPRVNPQATLAVRISHIILHQRLHGASSWALFSIFVLRKLVSPV